MKDIYHQLANDYCKNHCLERNILKSDNSKRGDCTNCQVEVFGKWLDENMKFVIDAICREDKK